MKPTELMKECGSESGRWHPESPEQWRWSLAHDDGAERVLAWIKLKSIGNGSPVCVNEHGQKLRIRNLAADLGLTEQNAINRCEQLQAEGRIRMVKGSSLAYRADVPERRREGDGNNSVQSCYPVYLVDFIKTLSAEKKASLEAERERFEGWKRALLAEAMAAARAEAERVELIIYSSFGAPKKILPKRRPAETKFIQLSLLPDANFVQSGARESVHNGKSTLHKPENGSVQSGPSLLGLEVEVRSQSVPQRAAPDRLTLIPKLLREELGSQLPSEVPTKRLCEQIDVALQGAPLPFLRTKIQAKQRKWTSFGLALILAKEVGDAWCAGAADRAEAEKKKAKRDSEAAQDSMALYRKTLADPDASDADRDLARELLGETAIAVGGAR